MIVGGKFYPTHYLYKEILANPSDISNLSYNSKFHHQRWVYAQFYLI